MTVTRSGAIAVMSALMVSTLGAHAGPPFPIIHNQTLGAYLLSVWTDPDATDDGSPGGRFWVHLQAAVTRVPAPAGTTVVLSVTAQRAGRQASRIDETAIAVAADGTQRFAALVLREEGPYDVGIAVVGPLGAERTHARVDATYALRPSRLAFALYAAPFVAIGALWVRLLMRRRAAA